MPGRVDQVEFVGFAVAGLIGHTHGLGLDGDAALAFQVHAVEVLIAHVAIADQAGKLEETIGQGRFAVVDMGDDGEITNMALLHGFTCASILGEMLSEKALVAPLAMDSKSFSMRLKLSLGG